MKVFSFDFDDTIGDEDELVPLKTVAYLASQTNHEVWAHGNPRLTKLLGMPGDTQARREYQNRWGDPTARIQHRPHERLEKRVTIGNEPEPPDPDITTALAECGDSERLARHQRVRLIGAFYPDADAYICVDNRYLGYLNGWEFYYPQEFRTAFSGLIDESMDAMFSEWMQYRMGRLLRTAIRRTIGTNLPIRLNMRKTPPIEIRR